MATTALVSISKAQKAQANESNMAAEASNRAAEKAKNAAEAYGEINDKLKSLQDKKNVINTLTKGTAE